MTQLFYKLIANDALAAIGIVTLAIIFSLNPKVGGYLIAIVVLAMLLNIEGLNKNGLLT